MKLQVLCISSENMSCIQRQYLYSKAGEQEKKELFWGDTFKSLAKINKEFD